jgi:hypothetical protein
VDTGSYGLVLADSGSLLAFLVLFVVTANAARAELADRPQIA